MVKFSMFHVTKYYFYCWYYFWYHSSHLLILRKSAFVEVLPVFLRRLWIQYCLLCFTNFVKLYRRGISSFFTRLISRAICSTFCCLSHGLSFRYFVDSYHAICYRIGICFYILFIWDTYRSFLLPLFDVPLPFVGFHNLLFQFPGS